MAKLSPRAPAAAVALYEALVRTNPKVERKGAQLPYTSINGNMFSLLTADGTLALRLSSADRDAFVKRYKSPPMKQYGVVMPEYVSVPASLLKQTATLAKYFDASYRYASALRAKPTTKPVKKKAAPAKAKASKRKAK